MPLALNEIRDRAAAFAREWQGASSERAEAQSFWNDFFHVFGLNRRRVAAFERPVRDLVTASQRGFIDLLWKGRLLVEHKSLGEDLDRAAMQARDYFPGLSDADLPRYVIVSDFARIRLYDLDADTNREFFLRELPQHIGLFGFISGYETRDFGTSNPVNVAAVRKLGELHDLLADAGYAGHRLEVCMVRLLFCLFADSTGIFETGTFRDYLDKRTVPDGSDLGPRLAKVFEVLSDPPSERSRTLDEALAVLPHVNGKLFAERLPIPDFNAAMREKLLDCARLAWGAISPAVFGSLFQSIKDVRDRRRLGEHYTTEANILKALNPLFLDPLRQEFVRVRHNARLLQEFHRRLAAIQVLDPACGCGNFLVVAYRELRLLELDVLRARYGDDQQQAVAPALVQSIVDVDQFHGIEIEEWPAQIALVAMWLTDHQMNLRVSEEFGRTYLRLPLVKGANIRHGNALRLDWASVAPPDKLSYIVGNPPFVGAKVMSAEQRADVAHVWRGTANIGVLDLVACWYRKTAELMAANPAIEAALVSTNSITQGEQPAVLWADLLRRRVSVNFAHRTFRWTSEARNAAAVHCVVIGFSLQDKINKLLFDYPNLTAEPQMLRVSRINPYLVDGPMVALSKLRSPICNTPSMVIGNKPIDDGNYLFTEAEREQFLLLEPAARLFFRPWVGSNEFINGNRRWCLWLGGATPSQLRAMPEARKRIEAVAAFRRASTSIPTQAIAATPTRFHVERMPDAPYMIVPRHSLERRTYIPMGFEPPETLAGDAALVILTATPYHFGVLTSMMHMAWTRAVCGRIKSDYRYSAGIVYNNFPWPEPDARQHAAIVAAAGAVLAARAGFPSETLANLYDPILMPPALTRAHRILDRAVDASYRRALFASDAERVAFLFERYQAISVPLAPAATPARRKRRATRPG